MRSVLDLPLLGRRSKPVEQVGRRVLPLPYGASWSSQSALQLQYRKSVHQSPQLVAHVCCASSLEDAGLDCTFERREHTDETATCLSLVLGRRPEPRSTPNDHRVKRRMAPNALAVGKAQKPQLIDDILLLRNGLVKACESVAHLPVHCGEEALLAAEDGVHGPGRRSDLLSETSQRQGLRALRLEQPARVLEQRRSGRVSVFLGSSHG